MYLFLEGGLLDGKPCNFHLHEPLQAGDRITLCEEFDSDQPGFYIWFRRRLRKTVPRAELHLHLTEEEINRRTVLDDPVVLYKTNNDGYVILAFDNGEGEIVKSMFFPGASRDEMMARLRLLAGLVSCELVRIELVSTAERLFELKKPGEPLVSSQPFPQPLDDKVH